MLRVGIAGLGGMGGVHARAHAAASNATIVAGADPIPERRGHFAQQYDAEIYPDYQTMIASAELDVVDVCLPTYLHSEAAVAAARAGRHVLCEKPMALTLHQCDAMIAAAQEAGVRLMIAQVLRFWPEYARIKEIADSGRLGRVVSATASRSGGAPRGSWFAEPAKSGGAVLDLHIHDIDFIAWLLGRPSLVSAAGVVSGDDGVDICYTTLTGFPGGAVAFAQTAWACGDIGFTYGLRVDLEKGTLMLTPGEGTGLLLAIAGGETEHPEAPRPEAPKGADTGINVEDLGGYYVEVQYFLDCVEKGAAPDRALPESSRQSVEICLAAAQSVRSGRPVKV